MSFTAFCACQIVRIQHRLAAFERAVLVRRWKLDAEAEKWCYAWLQTQHTEYAAVLVPPPGYRVRAMKVDAAWQKYAAFAHRELREQADSESKARRA